MREDTPSVALLTNLRSRNLGNLALSTAIQRLMSSAYGSEQLISLHRLPRPTIKLLTAGEDSGPTVWLRRLEGHLGNPDDLVRDAEAPTRGERKPAMTSGWTGGSKSTTRALAKKLGETNIALRANSYSQRTKARKHVAGILQGRDVVWNVAGEILRTRFEAARLLELTLAQGKKHPTAMINFTFEPSPRANEIYKSLMPKLSLAIARDEKAVARVLELGMAPERALYCPDAVFLVGSPFLPEFEIDPQPKRETIGLLFRGGVNTDIDQWTTIIRMIRRKGLEVDLLSSHQEVDIDLMEKLSAAVDDEGVRVTPEFESVRHFCLHLSGLHALVTTRIHPAIMALCCSTPVLAIDTYGTKMADGLGAAGFGSCVVDANTWEDGVERTIENPAPVDEARLAACRQRIFETYRTRFPLEP
jgi:polysaccharide pyruvyl transferase WcaK-like protein